MNQNLKEQLIQRRNYLVALLKKADEQILPADEGRLQIFSNHNHYRYTLFKRQPGHPATRTYISNNQLATAKAIAQSDYSKKISRLAQKEILQFIILFLLTLTYILTKVNMLGQNQKKS